MEERANTHLRVRREGGKIVGGGFGGGRVGGGRIVGGRIDVGGCFALRGHVGHTECGILNDGHRECGKGLSARLGA